MSDLSLTENVKADLSRHSNMKCFDANDVKTEIISDSDESLSFKKQKRKKSKLTKISKEKKKQFLPENPAVKLENESLETFEG